MSSEHVLAQLQQVSKVCVIPTYVKEAQAFEESDLGSLPPTALADPVKRRLPLNTKHATWMSALRYYSNPSAYSQTSEKALEKAASWWEIDGDIRRLKEGLQKLAAPREVGDDDFALVVDYAGNKVRQWPIDNAENVVKSAEELYAQRDTIPYAWRKQAAEKMIKAAKAYCDKSRPVEHKQRVKNGPAPSEPLEGQEGVMMMPKESEYLEKAAGMGTTSSNALRTQLRLRAYTVKDAQIRERLMAMSNSFDESDKLIDRGTLEKVASALDGVDRATGLYKRYRRDIPTPEEVCFGLTMSKAANVLADQIKLVDGTFIEKSALTDKPADAFDLLGSDLVDAIDDGNGKVDIEKAAELFPTLPRGDASLLKRALDLVGA